MRKGGREEGMVGRRQGGGDGDGRRKTATLTSSGFPVPTRLGALCSCAVSVCMVNGPFSRRASVSEFLFLAP